MTPHRVRVRLLRSLFGIALLGTIAACQSALAPERVVQVLEVAAQKAPCVGVASQECLQVREAGGTEWQLFYDAIEDFAFVPGFSYVLRVERRSVDKPPADGSSFTWHLLEIVSQTPAS